MMESDCEVVPTSSDGSGDVADKRSLSQVKLHHLDEYYGNSDEDEEIEPRPVASTGQKDGMQSGSHLQEGLGYPAKTQQQFQQQQWEEHDEKQPVVETIPLMSDGHFEQGMLVDDEHLVDIDTQSIIKICEYLCLVSNGADTTKEMKRLNEAKGTLAISENVNLCIKEMKESLEDQDENVEQVMGKYLVMDLLQVLETLTLKCDLIPLQVRRELMETFELAQPTCNKEDIFIKVEPIISEMLETNKKSAFTAICTLVFSCGQGVEREIASSWAGRILFLGIDHTKAVPSFRASQTSAELAKIFILHGEKILVSTNDSSFKSTDSSKSKDGQKRRGYRNLIKSFKGKLKMKKSSHQSREPPLPPVPDTQSTSPQVVQRRPPKPLTSEEYKSIIAREPKTYAEIIKEFGRPPPPPPPTSHRMTARPKSQEYPFSLIRSHLQKQRSSSVTDKPKPTTRTNPPPESIDHII